METTMNLLHAIQGMTDVSTSKIGPGLPPATIQTMLEDAGQPTHAALVDLYAQVNGLSMESRDAEIWILSLGEMLEANAFEHLREYSALDEDSEERENLEPYHVFAKNERAMWLVNLQTLETAIAYDFDVEALTLSFAQMLDRLVEHRFAAGWYEGYRA